MRGVATSSPRACRAVLCAHVQVDVASMLPDSWCSGGLAIGYCTAPERDRLLSSPSHATISDALHSNASTVKAHAASPMMRRLPRPALPLNRPAVTCLDRVV